MDDFSKQIILNEMNNFSAREFNEALMDLGRVLCQKKKSWCHLCPLANSCVAFKSREPLSFPREDLLKEKKSFELELLRVVVRDKNKILFYKKNDSEWLAGQWELPTFILRSDDEGLKQYPKVKSKKIFSEAVMFKTSITKYVILNRVLEMTLLDFEKLTQKIAIKYEFKVHNEKLNLSTSSIKSIGKLSQF
jgi:A/G-specific adenine glycosylase